MLLLLYMRKNLLGRDFGCKFSLRQIKILLVHSGRGRTSIPHKNGPEALHLALLIEKTNLFRQNLHELAHCVLENNVFEHDGKVFKQKQGTAIETKMAPYYAILCPNLRKRFGKSRH